MFGAFQDYKNIFTNILKQKSKVTCFDLFRRVEPILDMKLKVIEFNKEKKRKEKARKEKERKEKERKETSYHG